MPGGKLLLKKMPEQVTVATLNLRHGRAMDGSLVIGDIAERLAALPWQILAVQELDRGVKRSGGEDQLQVLAQASGAQAHFASALDLQGGQYGVALLVRDSRLSRPSVLRFPPQAGREPRVAALANTRWGEVATFHLAGRSDMQSLELLTEAPERPGLVLGDLNLGPEQLSLPSGWALAGSDHLTYPAHRPAYWIDHVLYRTQVWSEEASWTEHLPGTDHLALFARLLLA